MKRPTTILTVCLMTAAIAFLLSLLPQWERINAMNEREVAAFKETLSSKLTDDNLVDKLTQVRLQLALRKVQLHDGILSIDLAAPPNVASSRVYQDLYELVRFALGDHGNVKQLLVRIMETKDRQERDGQLLIALDARSHDDFLPFPAKESGTSELRQYLQSSFTITYTQAWKEIHPY
ncbi:hypothetical protein [Paenibacillus senegalensis]|uniref:hypothetical protein n=1 Tax=Paenibacillus senegalensis TaxID=1465766 RepID=UPI00028915A3|nr:hypothetical protein [Paenibacillus senegalensis]